MNWSNGRPAFWYGYTDLGKPRVPPLPQRIILTDRADGTRWLLTFNLTPSTSDGYGHISITDTIPRSFDQDYFEYGAYDGPYVPGSGGGARLLVRSGRLGFDDGPIPQGISDDNQGRIFARVGLQRGFREIIIPSTWKAGQDNTLAWSPVTV